MERLLDSLEEAIVYLYEKLSKAERAKIPEKDFIFPHNRSWPIHDE